MSDQPQLPLGRLTLTSGFALAYALDEPSPRTQADDLAYLAARSFPRWHAAVAPPWPDPDELRACEAEARDLAQALIDYAAVPARDHAYATLTAAADTLAVYEWAALLVHTCRGQEVPTTLDLHAFPGLARACRDALRAAQAAVNELKTTLENLAPRAAEGEAS